jgi:hypothetical protein
MSKQIAVAATGTALHQYMSGYQLETKQGWLTYPTAILDSLPNPFQVKMLKSPDGGAYDDPKGAVGE